MPNHDPDHHHHNDGCLRATLLDALATIIMRMRGPASLVGAINPNHALVVEHNALVDLGEALAKDQDAGKPFDLRALGETDPKTLERIYAALESYEAFRAHQIGAAARIRARITTLELRTAQCQAAAKLAAARNGAC